jgi:hypothetical protein
MVILHEVIDMPLSDSALAAYTWVQGMTQRDDPVSIELLMERFEWNIVETLNVQNELIASGLLADNRNADWT